MRNAQLSAFQNKAKLHTCAPQFPARHHRFFGLIAGDCSCKLCIVAVGLLMGSLDSQSGRLE